MRATSTDQTAIIVRIPAESPALTGEAPAVWTPTAEDQPAEPEPLLNPRLTVLAWLMPMLTLVGIAAWGLGTPGLSEDELATWGMVSIDWADFREVMANVDATVGPYYVVLRLWVALVGDSDLLLRLPSLLFAAGAAGLVAAIGIRLGGRRVGLAAGMIFAVLPGVSRYAQDARPYALVLLAAAWATYALLRMLDRPRGGTYLPYALAVLLLGLAHVVALLLLLAHLAIVLRVERTWRVRLAWAGAALVGLSPTLPMLYLGGAQSGSQIGWIPPLSWARLAETPDRLFGATIVAGAVLALALSALSLRPPAQVATIWALVPTAGLAAAALVTPLWVPRYLLFVVPAWALLASMALRRLTVLRGLVAVLGIAAVAVPAQQAVRTPYGHDFATRDISLIVRSHRAPGDAVLFGPFTNGDQRTSRDAFMRYLSAEERPADKLMARPPRTGGTLGAQECPDREIPSCFGSPARVWVIRKGSYPNILQNIGAAKEQLLRTSFVQSQTWSVKGFTIALYSRKPTA